MQLCCVFFVVGTELLSTVNSQLSGLCRGSKVIDNPKPLLKQKQSKHGTKWIQCKLFG
jgi:hypothetical protein